MWLRWVAPKNIRVLRFERCICSRRSASTSLPHVETIVGVEVHLQLRTQTKLFSRAPTTFAATPNEQVSLFDAAYPGTLPVLNEACIRHAVSLALALGCQVSPRVCFDRKHYFYPDLPHGFQITQERTPIAVNGQLQVPGTNKMVPITHLQLEMDSGKTVARDGSVALDLNRAGSALIEVVSAPALASGAEAADFVRTLQAVARALDISDGNMDQGSLRADVNVNLRVQGRELGSMFDPEAMITTPRVEIKNVTGLRFIAKAVDSELARQLAALRAGEELFCETRGYDARENATRPLRRKETRTDYRFTPEPDIPTVLITQALVDQCRAEMPELPAAACDRLVASYALRDDDASILVREEGAREYFEDACLTGAASPALIAAWVINELLARTRHAGLRSVADSPAAPRAMADLLSLVERGDLSGQRAKDVLDIMFSGDERAPRDIVREAGWMQNNDADLIARAAAEVIAGHPKQLAQYLEGKEKLAGFFVGKVMKQFKGTANPRLVNDAVMEALGKKKPE